MWNAVFIPFALVLMAYYAYYWTGLTTVMLDDARHARMKRHLDWTVTRRRTGLSKQGWRFW